VQSFAEREALVERLSTFLDFWVVPADPPMFTHFLNQLPPVMEEADAHAGAYAQAVKQAYDAAYAGVFSKNLVEAMRDRLPEGSKWTIQSWARLSSPVHPSGFLTTTAQRKRELSTHHHQHSANTTRRSADGSTNRPHHDESVYLTLVHTYSSYLRTTRSTV
jgi:hypothetical protein